VESNLAPLQNVATPKDKTEIRQILGLFVQCRNFIKNYAVRARPLTRLTGNVDWQWTSVEQDALDDLKGELLHQLSLYIPDYNLGFILDTDASDVGMGAVLFQIKDGKKRIVAFYSASFDLSMQARPVYYKEARVIFWSLGKARYIISCSPIQTRVRSDHAPLRWIKNSLKGPVSAWRIDEASDLDYRVEYIKGPDNIIGDAFSRPPFVRPSEILIQGLRAAFEKLLETLPETARVELSVWVYAGKSTPAIGRVIQQWRLPKNALLMTSVKTSLTNPKWQLALVAPKPENAPVVCNQLYLLNRSFCCLVPSDLVQFIPRGARREANPRIEKQLKESRKVTMLSADMTWIIHDCGVLHDQVFSSEERAISKSSVGPALDLDTTDWIKKQQDERPAYEKKFGGKISIRLDGLLLYSPGGEVARIIVPSIFREPLTMRYHEFLSHIGANRTFTAIYERYVWPGMRTQILTLIRACGICVLAQKPVDHWRIDSFEL
jgi:hypothetical protein